MWQPGSATELASVGDDFKLLLWDTRAGSAPAAALEKAHGENDLHCVDWSSLELHLLVTGMPLQSCSSQGPCLAIHRGLFPKLKSPALCSPQPAMSLAFTLPAEESTSLCTGSLGSGIATAVAS